MRITASSPRRRKRLHHIDKMENASTWAANASGRLSLQMRPPLHLTSPQAGSTRAAGTARLLSSFGTAAPDCLDGARFRFERGDVESQPASSMANANNSRALYYISSIVGAFGAGTPARHSACPALRCGRTTPVRNPALSASRSCMHRSGLDGGTL